MQDIVINYSKDVNDELLMSSKENQAHIQKSNLIVTKINNFNPEFYKATLDMLDLDNNYDY